MNQTIWIAAGSFFGALCIFTIVIAWYRRGERQRPGELRGAPKRDKREKRPSSALAKAVEADYVRRHALESTTMK
jgi:hypothetical protein